MSEKKEGDRFFPFVDLFFRAAGRIQPGTSGFEEAQLVLKALEERQQTGRLIMTLELRRACQTVIEVSGVTTEDLVQVYNASGIKRIIIVQRGKPQI